MEDAETLLNLRQTRNQEHEPQKYLKSSTTASVGSKLFTTNPDSLV